MLRSLVTQLPFFVCLFWAVFLFIQKGAMVSKRILGLFMFFSALMHLSYVVFFSSDMSLYMSFDWLFLFSSLLIIPTFYLYFFSVAKSSMHRYSSFFHYLPAVLFLIAYVIAYNSATESQIRDYLYAFMYAKKTPQFDLIDPAHRLNILFVANRIIFTIQTVFYLIISFFVILNYRKRIRNLYSNLEGRDLKWIVNITVCILLLSIMGAVFNVLGRTLFQHSDLLLMIPSFFYSAVLFFIGHIGNLQDFTIKDIEIEELKLVGDVQKETSEQPSLIRQRLEQIMSEKQLFLNNDLRISSLCKELNTNRTYLSQVLNDELNENFNSYINKYRVHHAIFLLQDQSLRHYSLDRFGELSGFGSTISMVRAFKQVTGKTPAEYRE